MSEKTAMHACAHIGQVKYGWEQEAGEQEKERERGETSEEERACEREQLAREGKGMRDKEWEG